MMVKSPKGSERHEQQHRTGGTGPGKAGDPDWRGGSGRLPAVDPDIGYGSAFAGETRASALLTPQGRILADMMVLRVEDSFVLDCDASRAEDLFTRLRRYKLRRPITLEMLDDHQLWVGWDGAAMPGGASTDPRHPALGWRWIGAAGSGPESASGSGTVDIDQWHAVRIAAGVPQGPVDLQPERALMLEAGLDRLGAVDFEKGCYVGQEVTARTHYRGLVKRRIVPLEVSGGCPASGEAVSEGERDLGTVLSVAGGGGEGRFALPP